jgi:large subunit ribosomal protein L33
MAAKKGLREYVTLECKQCKGKNYRTSKQMKPRGQKKEVEKLALKKFCRKCHAHTLHAEKKK